MRRLYLRIYFALLASLAVFALTAALLWRQLGEGAAPPHEIAATLAANVLPEPDAPRAVHQAALEKLAANLRADASLYTAGHELLASVGEPLAPSRSVQRCSPRIPGGAAPSSSGASSPSGRS